MPPHLKTVLVLAVECMKIMIIIMLSQAFPQAVLLLTIYTVMKKLGLLDNYLSLVLSFITFTLPMGTWMLKSYFDQIPDALMESAKIDGASPFQIMTKIVMPLAIRLSTM